ncbi:hypothetical protein [Leuconostoc falkenbergense]|uniref:hypothetical protein n=1 Tax=Leuconostoc falkenbergense TaxID=2766470 RepID=UPI00166DC053|nr:hypothetical protein [Leuconostoc falkenbergense]
MILIAIYAIAINGLLLWRLEYKLYKINEEFERLDLRIDVIGDRLHEHIRKEKFVRLFGKKDINVIYKYDKKTYSYLELYDLYKNTYGYIIPDLVIRIDISKYTQKGTK